MTSRLLAIAALLLAIGCDLDRKPPDTPPDTVPVDTVEADESEFGPCETSGGDLNQACVDSIMLHGDSTGGPGAGDSTDMGEPAVPETAAESAAAYGPRGAPKVKAATAPRLAGDCIAGQTCQKKLTWTRPSNYVSATDKATVTWKTGAGAVVVTHANITGTADSAAIPAPADATVGSFTATLCYTRTGVNTACNAPLAFTVQGTPAPLPPITAVTSVRKAGGDTSWVKVTVTATGRDTTFVFWNATAPNATTRTTKKAGQTLTDSLRRLLAPQDSALGTVLPYGQKGTVRDTGAVVTWRIDDPRVPVDTATALQLSKMDVLPDTAKLYTNRNPDGTPNTINTKQQFCPFLFFKDGKFALPDEYYSVSSNYCQGYVNYWKGKGKVQATAAQQAIANEVCVTWTATGGTITSAICPGASPTIRSTQPFGLVLSDSVYVALETPPSILVGS